MLRAEIWAKVELENSARGKLKHARLFPPIQVAKDAV